MMEYVQKISHIGISFVLSSIPFLSSLNNALKEQLNPKFLTRGQEGKIICFKNTVINHINCQLITTMYQIAKSDEYLLLRGFNSQEQGQKTQLGGPAALTKDKPQRPHNIQIHHLGSQSGGFLVLFCFCTKPHEISARTQRQ